MGAINYYRSLINLNPEFSAYKNRVVSDGGAIVDEGVTIGVFETLIDIGSLDSLILGISKDAGNKITSSKIETAYSLVLDGKYDCSQTDPAKRPTSDYDFAGVTSLDANINNSIVYISDTFSWFFRIGDAGVLSGAQRLIYNGGDGPNQASNVYCNDGDIELAIEKSDGVPVTVSTTTVISNNKSYLVVFNGTNGNVKIYVDGVLDSTTTTSVPTDGQLRNGFTIAAYILNGFGQDFNGELTSAYVWDSDESANSVSIHNNL